MEPRAEQKTALARAWERFVTVDVPDEEEARVGRLFCVMMVLTFVLSLALVMIFVTAIVRDLVDSPLKGWLETAFPLAFLPLSVIGYSRAKQGYVSSTARWFVWVNFIGIALAVFIFDGISSPAWLLFFWPVALSGMFLQPVSAVRMAFGVVIYYAVLAVLANYAFRAPTSSLSFDYYYFLTRAFGLLMLVATAGFVNYLSMSSVHQTMARARQISQDLRGTQRMLERRVNERTDELTKRAAQFRAIAELNHAIASISDMQELLNTAVHLIAERLGYDHVGIFFVDPHGEWAVLRAASSEGGQRMLARGHRLQVGRQGIVGYVAATGLPRLAFSVGEDAVWFNNPDLPDTQSEMSLPLIARGQTTIGVLDIQTHVAAAFTEEDVTVLHILADGIAVAIANALSLEETTAALARLERYQEQDALRAWRQALSRRQMQVGYTFDSGFVYPVQIDTADAATAQAITDVTTQVTDTGQHLLLAPIRVQNRNVGVLSFEKSAPWTEEQIQLARFVVEQLDLALDNARLLEETRLRANQERARSDIVGRVRAMTSTDAILRNAARELGLALQVERSRIQLLPPGEGRLESQPQE
ncbi:MAG: GAF domain-containing protein [Anaerolineae bacterium]